MPGHQVPEPYQWSEDFKVFYESLDAEHKGLFDGIFACEKALKEGEDGTSVLSELATKVKTHFTNEEKMMEEAKYGNLSTHKKAHNDFVDRLGALKLNAGDIEFAKQWLVDHIKDIDFNYKGKLN